MAEVGVQARRAGILPARWLVFKPVGRASCPLGGWVGKMPTPRRLWQKLVVKPVGRASCPLGGWAGKMPTPRRLWQKLVVKPVGRASCPLGGWVGKMPTPRRLWQKLVVKPVGRARCPLGGWAGKMPTPRRLWQKHFYWTFDYFFYNAAKRPLRARFAASLILVPIFSETLMQSAFQEQSAQFSQKSRSLKPSGKQDVQAKQGGDRPHHRRPDRMSRLKGGPLMGL